MQVLIAEDSAVMRSLLLSCLRKWDYDVVEAKDGAEAWHLFQQKPFSLVLTDWMMPEMDGLELIRLIRSSDLPSYVYIVLLTAKSEKEDLVAAMEAGADDFLEKPFDPDELRVRLREGERIISLEHRLAEQNRVLRETQAALVQSEKMASLGQLAAGMAHEINNPIAYVCNNLAVLKRDVSDTMKLLEAYRKSWQSCPQTDQQSSDKLAKMEQDLDLPWINDNLPRLFTSSLDGLQRVRNIIANLRDFARLDEAVFDELDLNDAVRTTAEVLVHELTDRQIQLDTKLNQLPKVLCHPGKFNQALLNLLLNAVQASEPGGTIEVRSSAANGAVTIEVEDHGCGIPEADLQRIFEPFFTTKPVGTGTGLGLAISYGIIRDHGGSIHVDSQVGQGSTFRVVIPLEPPTNSSFDQEPSAQRQESSS